MKSLGPYIEKAKKELAVRTLRDVQVETAMTWAGRAVVAMSMGKSDDAHEYAHESLEHAALSGSDTLLRYVRSAFETSGIEP